MISRRPSDCTSSPNFWPKAFAVSEPTFAAWARTRSIKKESVMDLNRLNRFALIVRLVDALRSGESTCPMKPTRRFWPLAD
jgi:hypothetical protein